MDGFAESASTWVAMWRSVAISTRKPCLGRSGNGVSGLYEIHAAKCHLYDDINSREKEEQHLPPFPSYQQVFRYLDDSNTFVPLLAEHCWACKTASDHCSIRTVQLGSGTPARPTRRSPSAAGLHWYASRRPFEGRSVAFDRDLQDESE